MENVVTVAEVKASLDSLLDRARTDEEWMIVRPDGRPVAKLVVLPAGGSGEPLADHTSLIGLMRGRIELSPDFDEPLEDFKPYME